MGPSAQAPHRRMLKKGDTVYTEEGRKAVIHDIYEKSQTCWLDFEDETYDSKYLMANLREAPKDEPKLTPTDESDGRSTSFDTLTSLQTFSTTNETLDAVWSKLDDDDVFTDANFSSNYLQALQEAARFYKRCTCTSKESVCDNDCNEGSMWTMDLDANIVYNNSPDNEVSALNIYQVYRGQKLNAHAILQTKDMLVPLIKRVHTYMQKKLKLYERNIGCLGELCVKRNCVLESSDYGRIKKDQDPPKPNLHQILSREPEHLLWGCPEHCDGATYMGKMITTDGVMSTDKSCTGFCAMHCSKP